MTPTDLPMISPSAQDLAERLAALKSGGYRPTSNALAAVEKHGRHEDADVPIEPQFSGLPVKLYDGQIGVSIAYAKP